MLQVSLLATKNFEEVSEVSPRQFSLMHQASFGMIDLRERHAVDAQNLMKVRIVLPHGDVDKFQVWVVLRCLIKQGP